MFLFPAIVTFLAGLAVAGYCGWEAFRGYAAKIDTRSEAGAFFADAGLTLVGLCAVVTALHAGLN